MYFVCVSRIFYKTKLIYIHKNSFTALRTFFFRIRKKRSTAVISLVLTHPSRIPLPLHYSQNPLDSRYLLSESNIEKKDLLY